jgi:hypothetical protein
MVFHTLFHNLAHFELHHAVGPDYLDDISYAVTRFERGMQSNCH